MYTKLHICILSWYHMKILYTSVYTNVYIKHTHMLVHMYIYTCAYYACISVNSVQTDITYLLTNRLTVFNGILSNGWLHSLHTSQRPLLNLCTGKPAYWLTDDMLFPFWPVIGYCVVQCPWKSHRGIQQTTSTVQSDACFQVTSIKYNIHTI